MVVKFCKCSEYNVFYRGDIIRSKGVSISYRGFWGLVNCSGKQFRGFEWGRSQKHPLNWFYSKTLILIVHRKDRRKGRSIDSQMEKALQNQLRIYSRAKWIILRPGYVETYWLLKYSDFFFVLFHKYLLW